MSAGKMNRHKIGLFIVSGTSARIQTVSLQHWINTERWSWPPRLIQRFKVIWVCGRTKKICKMS